MRSLGEYLRAERLARGISLEQISADTRITIKMLQAVEEGDVEKLPAAVFTKGFLRAYAKQIGLDPEAVIVEYQDLIEEVDARRETMEKFHQRLHPKSSKKKVSALLFALALLVGLALFLWRSKHTSQEAPSATRGESIGVIQRDETTSRTDSVSDVNQAQTTTRSRQALDSSRTEIRAGQAGPDFDTQAPSVSPADETVPSIREGSVYAASEYRRPTEQQSSASAPYVLRAKAVETTWLHITIDEIHEREYLLQPGEQMSWRASSGYKLHVGNAAGVQLYLNDKPIKPLGASGRVVHLELPDSSLSIRAD